VTFRCQARSNEIKQDTYHPADIKSPQQKHILEHGSAVKKARQKAFPRRKQLSSPAYWYLFILGTEPSRQGQGLGGTMLEHLKDHVKKSSQPHLPLWLESSSEGSRKLYKRHGFEDVDEMTLGIGVVGPDGRAKKGGEGVKTWGMIWRPEGK
jgi:GNAT superfamily N-acetyltransferase